MLNIFKQFKEAGIRPDVFTYTALINGFALGNDPKSAVKYLDEMHSLGVRANEYTLTAMARAVGVPRMQLKEIRKQYLEHRDSLGRADKGAQAVLDVLKEYIEAVRQRPSVV
jgi:pentatricopeptide repeat protein